MEEPQILTFRLRDLCLKYHEKTANEYEEFMLVCFLFFKGRLTEKLYLKHKNNKTTELLRTCVLVAASTLSVLDIIRGKHTKIQHTINREILKKTQHLYPNYN